MMNTPTDQEYSNLLQQREPEYAREAVERFVRRFEPSYRKLVYYAALPLVLTPELLHYLRNHFLRREQVPWAAEVDLLLSELCREVGYELYAMETAVRAHALQEMRKQPGGAEQMRGVAWLLLSYVQQLARHPAVSQQELQAQQWAAMAYLHEKRAEAVGEIVTALRQSALPADTAAPDLSACVNHAEFLRLARLVQELAPELEQYPELVEYARDVTQVFVNPAVLPRERLLKKRQVLGQELPEIRRIAPEQPRVQIIESPPLAREWTEPVTGMEFVWIPPGTFWMGQSEVDKDYLLKTVSKKDYEEYYLRELPRHEVRIQRGFWMGKYPVTQGQWLDVMGQNPSHFAEAKVGEQWRKHPVESVSWDQVQVFLKKFQSFGDFGNLLLRLPSEAEWEYACRAGSEGLFCFGNEVEQLKDYAWYGEDWEKGATHPVGQLKPNAWGLYDVHGNVWEWCADDWHDNYENAPEDGSAWKTKGEESVKLLRGGSWGNHPLVCRCALRTGSHRDGRVHDFGVRVVVVFGLHSSPRESASGNSSRE